MPASHPSSSRQSRARSSKPYVSRAKSGGTRRAATLSPIRLAARKGVLGELADREHGERLNKVLANAGVASRREADAMIAAGRVRVNGVPVTEMPAWVDLSTDRVEVDGEAIRRVRNENTGNASDQLRGPLTYVLLNKPKRVITTTNDPEGRPHVLDLVDSRQIQAARLFPVGRLDAESTGLILLTNDGDLAHRLTHPRYEVAKEYRVQVRGCVSEEDVAQLQKGLILATRGRGPRKASMEHIKLLSRRRDSRYGDRSTLGITLREGQNREIRRMLARMGFKVRKLERVAVGPLVMKGLALGQWRPLTGMEVNALYRAVGLKRQKTTGAPASEK